MRFQHRRHQPRQQDKMSHDSVSRTHQSHQAEKQRSDYQVSEAPVDYPSESSKILQTNSVTEEPAKKRCDEEQNPRPRLDLSRSCQLFTSAHHNDTS